MEAPSRIRIIIDSRERGEILDLLGRHAHVDLETRQLEVGDYDLGGGAMVERKTGTDFVRCIEDHSLFHQVGQLNQVASAPFLIIEGEFQQRSRIPFQNRRQAVTYLATQTGVSVLLTADAEESALWLVALAEHAQRTVMEPSLRTDKPKALLGKQLYVLEGLPGVGRTNARKLLAAFGSVAGVFAATEAELALVVKKALAGKLREFVQASATRDGTP